MKSKIVLAIGAVALACSLGPATAQQTYTRAMVVSACGSQSFPLGGYEPLTVLANGTLCSSVGAGGGSASGGPAYGPDAAGGAPTKPPILNGLLDASGNVRSVSPSFPIPGMEVGSSAAAVGIAPVVTPAGTSVLGKNAPGNLYQAYAVNTTTTPAYLVAINAAAVPASGATISPVDVGYIGGAVGSTGSVNYGAGPPNAYSIGIVLLITTSLTTYAPGGAAFIQARVR